MHGLAGRIQARRRRVRALAIAGACLLAGMPAPAPAQPSAQDTQPAAESPDVAAGRLIAERGVQAGHVGCAACHMMNGAGQPDMAIPRLAGAAPAYLQQQLSFFAAGKRTSFWMTPFARALTPQQMRAVAAYYAAQSAPVEADAEVLVPVPAGRHARGQTVFETGGGGAGVMPCAGCHGPAGQGMGPFPPLAGQSAPYVLGQLRRWKRGSDRDPMGKIMVMEVRGMNDADMQAVAAFVQSLSGNGPGSGSGSAQ
ncbi:c-type cytochrome [Nguyenibacter sp. L1]|uniref:c-type cytochrome n=1 Tax=Nguyenibacter sp. L1 TaxID=3049350 RepID=UPI002B4668F3|nr:c-type cytochrome [Nguyenibacter sp. L1]WRH87248.1 c-type cytochrome [Nguyenibacter sp. L1]